MVKALWRRFIGGSLVALGERSVPTGQELLAEFIQYGNQQPFEEIVRRYAGMVFNVCFRVTKDKHEAEDATQAVFLTLALQARRGTDIKALGPWLQQVAKRLSLDTRRSKKRRKTREERFQVEQANRHDSILGDSLPSADMDELKTILHEELQKLPAKYRMPLILHYFGGLSRDEMAAELNCKPSTLGVRIFRGREMLAGRLSGRGINISMGMLALAMGYAIKRAVSESMICSTSHAATAMMAGYDGSAFASANVIGLTRRASSALAMGKVRITAITLMMAATSLGAGAKALGVLPQINLQRMIYNQVNRIIQPLFRSVTPSLRVDAQSLPAAGHAAVSRAGVSNAEDDFKLVRVPRLSAPVSVPQPVFAAQHQSSGALVINFANSPLKSALTQPIALSSRWFDQSSTAAPGALDRTTGGFAIASTDVIPQAEAAESLVSTATLPAAVAAEMGESRTGDSLPSRNLSAAYGHIASPVITTNDLIIGTSGSSSAPVIGRAASIGKTSGSSPSASAASQIATIQVPAVGGSITQSSTGVLRGYGQIDRTGALVVNANGQIVADGGGVDRTLLLTSFGSVVNAGSDTRIGTVPTSGAISGGLTSAASILMPVVMASIPTASAVPTPTSSPDASSQIAASSSTAGWYAIDHGRLALALQPGVDKSTLTWGEDPTAGRLTLVNSVRLKLDSSRPGQNDDHDPTGLVPGEMALLSADRLDAPVLSELDGVAIGLWQVDPSAGPLSGADITICYDALLASELGAPASSIDLWTLGSEAGAAWQPVDPSCMLLDTSDHLISGYADDVSYFAVTAAAAPGTNIDRLIADHLSVVSGLPSPGIGSGPAGSSGVPEPTSLLPLIALGAGLLGRRRYGAANR